MNLVFEAETGQDRCEVLSMLSTSLAGINGLNGKLNRRG